MTILGNNSATSYYALDRGDLLAGGRPSSAWGGAVGVQWHTLSFDRRCPLEYTIITVFRKNKKANLTKAERNALKKRADEILDSYWR
jgi:hypothetical protein